MPARAEKARMAEPTEFPASAATTRCQFSLSDMCVIIREFGPGVGMTTIQSRANPASIDMSRLAMWG